MYVWSLVLPSKRPFEEKQTVKAWIQSRQYLTASPLNKMHYMPENQSLRTSISPEGLQSGQPQGKDFSSLRKVRHFKLHIIIKCPVS